MKPDVKVRDNPSRRAVPVTSDFWQYLVNLRRTMRRNPQAVRNCSALTLKPTILIAAEPKHSQESRKKNPSV
jgi:hypothetical protein